MLARLDDPTKNWKFRVEDLDDRAHWEDYTEAYREVLTRCSTPEAPWFVVPADNKALRNYLVARMLVHTLESLTPTYPAMQDAVRDAARGVTAGGPAPSAAPGFMARHGGKVLAGAGLLGGGLLLSNLMSKKRDEQAQGPYGPVYR